MLTDLFNHLGMTTKEQDIYHVVLAHHKTSASIVAQTLTRERTSTYKMMKNMVSQGFLSTTHEHGTTFFLPTAWTQLWHRFESQSRQTQSLLESHKSLKQEYESLQSSHQFATQVTLRSGTAGIDYAYDTMNQIIADQGLIYTTCLATHTIDAQSGTDQKIQSIYNKFYQKLLMQGVTVSSHLGIGMGIMESMTHSLSTHILAEMALANDATHIRIVGHDIFILLFSVDPQTIHIHSPQVASLLMFISTQLSKKHSD